MKKIDRQNQMTWRKDRGESIPNNPMMTFNKTVKDILALGQGRLGKTQNH